MCVAYVCAQVCSGELYLPEPTYPAAFYSQEYGMGWWVGNYRGHPIAHHGGEVFGESSMVRTEEHHTQHTSTHLHRIHHAECTVYHLWCSRACAPPPMTFPR